MITIERIQKILLHAKNKNVLAIGDVMLDGYFTGEVERFSQEAPVPIVTVSEEKFFPGGAGNSAACMAKIGLKPDLISIVGNKERISYSDILKEECSALGITPFFIKDNDRKTTLKLRIAAVKTTKQHIARVDMEDTKPLNSEKENEIIDLIKKTFSQKKHSVISIHDYKKGFLTKNIFKFLMELSKNEKIPVFADLKQETFIEFKKHITAPALFYLKPNKDESVQTAKLLNGFNKNGNTDEEIAEIANIIQKEIPIHVIITRGSKGAALFEVNKEPYFVRLQEVEDQFDVAGAGDTVEAFLVASFLGNASMEEALEIAIAASQVAIRKFGTSVVTQEELRKWIQKHND
jgi:D-beta-D-heptose 7-phosphate kinase/D-beta-D-heptose 1-phosphate adenosyltransferase